MSDEPDSHPGSDFTTTGTEGLIDGSNPRPIEPDEPSTPVFRQPIVAPPDHKFFLKRMLIGFVVVGVGLWLLYDGFIGWPRHNERYASLQAQIHTAVAANDITTADNLNTEWKELGNPKSARDILLQKVLGFIALPAGLYLLAKFLRENKGLLRLEDDVVHVPGHPPVPIASITAVENGRWDRKGVALFDYKLADGKTGRFKIDDFVFTRPPTDAIHDELIAKMPKA